MTAEVSSTKQRILRVAADLFARNGYHGTGVAEISEAVSLGRGAFYHHIKSKEELLFEIIISSVGRLVAEAEELLLEGGSVEERLRQLSRHLMRHNLEHLPAAMIFMREVSTLTGKNRAEVMALRHRYEELWASVLAEGIETAELRPVDPVAVKGILGSFNHAPVWARPGGRLSAEEIADVFVESVLAGLRRPRPGPVSGHGARQDVTAAEPA